VNEEKLAMGLMDKLRSAGQWFGSKCSAARDFVVEKVKAAVEVVKDKVQSGIEVGAKVCGAITGKTTADEAARRYDALCRRAGESEADFNRYVKQRTDELQALCEQVNEAKGDFQTAAQTRFVTLVTRIAHWEVPAELQLDAGRQAAATRLAVRERSQVILIDFERQPILNAAKAIFTVGFWTRKQARESLQRVAEAEQEFELELAKVEAERQRLALTVQAMRQVADYFATLLQTYEEVLDELGYALQVVRAAVALGQPHLVEQRLDCALLPAQHLRSLIAADQLTRILHAMSNRRYLDDQMQSCSTDCNDLQRAQVQATTLAEQLTHLAA
jgi:hypothetical protein